MKKVTVVIILTIFMMSDLCAQWTASGSNIYNSNTGNVGIGTSSPGEKLSIGYGMNSDLSVGSGTNNKAYFSTYNNNAGFAINRRISDGTFANPSLPTASFGFCTSNNNSYIQFSTSNANNTMDVERLRIDKDGNVGIGTTNPLDKLVINSGNISFTTQGNFGLKWEGGSRLYEQTPTSGGSNRMIYQPNGDRLDILNETGNVFIASFQGPSSVSPNRILFYNGLVIGNENYLTTAPPVLGAIIKGNVGIGTSTPQARLDVSGDIYSNSKIFIGTPDVNTATKIALYSLAVDGAAVFTKAVVKLNTAWPDYVFHKEYKLPTLNEIEQFIKQNGHLPEVSTSQEVEKNGIDLGDNQVILLRKIEELTLFAIEQNKKIEEQAQRISELEKKLE